MLKETKNILLLTSIPIVGFAGYIGIKKLKQNKQEKTNGDILHYKFARKFVGEKEIYNDKGFYNKNLEEKMLKSGWVKNNAYCTAFLKMVLLESYTDKIFLNYVKKTFSSSSQTTLAKLKKANDFFVQITNIKNLKQGDIIIYKKLNKKWAGHGEIFDKWINDNKFQVISANSSFNGSHGITIAKRAVDAVTSGNFRFQSAFRKIIH